MSQTPLRSCKQLARAVAVGRRKQVPWAVIKVRSETEIIRCLDPRFFVEGKKM
ncbi:unnamed protein product [Ectocarpus sp. 6 AP-2014]